MSNSLPFFACFVLTLLTLVVLALGGKTRARGSLDFSLGGRAAGPWFVSGAITGTLVGGASTIGTVQLAFLYGLSAWWFTLGAGLACLFLALFIAIPARNGDVETIPQCLSRYHGENARVVASLFSALGMFIQILAQLLACGAILSVLFDLPLFWSSLIATTLVAMFTLGGGMKGAGLLGLVKLLLLYVTMLAAGFVAYRLSGGWSELRSFFPSFPWFSLFGYGTKEGLSDLLSMLVGVVSTQTYLQAVFAARDPRAARRGALLSAALIPPLGLLGVVVGLYMQRTNPGLESALALPTFIMSYLPAAFAGVAFATLLIAAVGTASGLALGVATTLKVDVVDKFEVQAVSPLAQMRILTLCVVIMAFVLLLFNLGTTIMHWSFLSMGLRGATLCFPLLFAIFFKERTSSRAGILSTYIAPTIVLVYGFIGSGTVPPLYLGLGCSFLILSAGMAFKWRHRLYS
jgi:SSS family solute:Na+ symporter